MKQILILTLTMVVMASCAGEVKSTNGSKRFEGIWAESEESNALFVVKGDTIKNVEHGDKMAFQVIDDTLTIDYVDSKAKYFIAKSSDDSLVLRNPDGSFTRLYRRSR